MDKSTFFKNLVKVSGSTSFGSKILLAQMDSYLHRTIVENNNKSLQKIKTFKYEFVSSMLHSAMKNYRKGYISNNTIQKLSDVFIENTLYKEKNDIRESRTKFIEEKGYKPPSFITLSPTKHCNLHCKGCYACSTEKTSHTLDFEIVDRICNEVHDIFGSRFITISGGEPFTYRSNGKVLLDIFRKYNDMFFLVYTNGTLIDEGIAKELSKLGNVTPAVSLEGYEAETDDRRGSGVYNKILRSFDNLRDAGVPFGISVTATSKNVEILLTEKFYDYYFEEMGATYMWQFQFFPIGRGRKTFEMVVNPHDRIRLYSMWKHQIKEKKHCIADFWNSGVLSDGCIAYGGNRGYLYINWNGDIMPCVFVPFTVSNIKDLYFQGKTLNDALDTDLMKRGRRWQKQYALDHSEDPGNLLMPCSIRDHYANFTENILIPDAKGENSAAQKIIDDLNYKKKMCEYDKKLSVLSRTIWKNHYLQSEIKV